jgi:hypothetical protein
MTKIGRNKPCPCGSGRKYKHCHGRPTAEPAAPIDVRRMMTQRMAEERIREIQQGRGRPIISAKLREHQMVAVGNTVHFSKTWKAFPDFLALKFRNWPQVARKTGAQAFLLSHQLANLSPGRRRPA